MKFLTIISCLLFAIQGFATVSSSEGLSSVDPVFRSNDAFVMITGDAAYQLYKHLEIEPGVSAKRKIGKNVVCRLSLTGRDYVCEMWLDETGAFRNAGIN